MTRSQGKTDNGILLNALQVRPDGAGISRYSLELARELAALRDDLVVAVQNCAADRLGLPESRLIRCADRTRSSGRILTEQLSLPLRARRFALAHYPDMAVPLIHPWPVVVTCHDLAYYIHPQAFTAAQRLWKKSSAHRAARRAERIICDSRATADDVRERLAVPPERLRVVYPGVRRQPEEAVRPAAAPDGPFVLAVGTLEPRKNLPRLFEALEQLRAAGLPHRLVIAGRRGWIYQGIVERAQRAGLRDRVVLAGYRTDAELNWLYGHAEVLAYVSVYEGFGFPPVEAMLHGLPVVAARGGAIEEVCGDAAEYVDPFRVEDIARGLRAVLTEAPRRAHLIAAGRQRAARYDWKATARAVSAIYDEVLS